MNKIILGIGLAVLTFTSYYFIRKSNGEESSPFLTYGLGVASCIFISLALYNVMQHFKKK
jgi:hypothetical protein